MSIIAKNITASGVELEDLAGLYIDAYGEADLREFFTLDEINNSENLDYWIGQDVIRMNNGVRDLTKEESLEHTYVQTEFESVHTFLDLNDTPTTYSGHGGHLLLVNNNETGAEFYPASDIINKSILWTSDPTYNGIIRLVGWYMDLNQNVSLSSGSSVVASQAGYNSYYTLNIESTSGAPFTVNVVGTVVDEQNHTYTNTTDSITVTGTGYYRSQHAFINAPTISIVETGKSCIFDLYKFSTWDCFGGAIILKAIGTEFVPNQNNWYFNVSVWHVKEN